MGKKAVDAVLLPDETMIGKAIEANAELVKRFGRKIVLNKKDCLPHISLAMGCVDEKNIISVERILRTIAKELPLGELKVLGVHVSKNAAGEKVSAFEVEKTTELQSLHETVMERLEPYLSNDVTAEEINDDEVAETTLSWIKNYRGKSSFGKFFPHITIGYGEVGNLSPFPIKFAASKLALCHLGNHCTCKEILFSAGL
ncbi:MAG: 2'-5' RNA ligase family protein [Phycisphaerae bacterium]|nr:2'-5' RNA ligase family protein [Phycisphaerae bacterium]MDD5381372.1 2'-5' RNA ligase family protein [Phycisphaerae bacterium]